jgi:hypothetical protein
MTEPAAGRRLRGKLELAFRPFAATAERLWTSPRLAEIYPEYLCTMHGIVRSSVPLMEAALARARTLAEQDDEVAAGVARYLAGHVREEAGHDRWILQDLEALGGDPEEPLRRMPSRRVAALVGAQYYWLLHHHPVSLLGHVAVMEGFPPSETFADLLRERTGYPREAFRSLARHSRLDVRHRDELYEALDALPLEPEHEHVVGVSALHTIDGVIDVFVEVLERVEGRAAEPVR